MYFLILTIQIRYLSFPIKNNIILNNFKYIRMKVSKYIMNLGKYLFSIFGNRHYPSSMSCRSVSKKTSWGQELRRDFLRNTWWIETKWTLFFRVIKSKKKLGMKNLITVSFLSECNGKFLDTLYYVNLGLLSLGSLGLG